jgi:cyclophilin family peptidyl-prolyl cis-trans isomerase
LLQGAENSSARSWLEELRWVFSGSAPEIEIALVRVSPKTYLEGLGANTAVARQETQRTMLTDWRAASSLAQGLAEIAALPDSTKDRSDLSKRAIAILGAMLDYRNSGLNINTLVAVHSEYAIPDVLRAYAAFKPADLATVLRNHLKETDVVIRATAAELLGELPPTEENANALIAALQVALKDEKLNDAALATIDSLAKQQTSAANEAIESALKSDDHLVRRRAVTALKTNSASHFSKEIGTVQTRNRLGDYERALARAGRHVLATVKTSKGNFTIELLPADAPLTVDNFVQLARRGYFNRIPFHRVVPNFVIQGGDPRGDGNGGPGYSIRCEINMVPYDRGAVGMALSGKDTGGSQWFVTHSPQPHLDGGYTVFGRVVKGMDVVDTIVRGDSIVSVSIREEPGAKKRVN